MDLPKTRTPIKGVLVFIDDEGRMGHEFTGEAMNQAEICGLGLYLRDLRPATLSMTALDALKTLVEFLKEEESRKRDEECGKEQSLEF